MRREKEDEKNLQYKYQTRRRDDASRERIKELIQKQDEAISLMLEQREGMRQYSIRSRRRISLLSSILLLLYLLFHERVND